MGEIATPVDIARWIGIFDMSDNLEIDFEEFVATMLVAMDNLITDDDISDIFWRCDTRGAGYITVEDLIEAMDAVGKHLTYDDAKLMIQEGDLNDNGQIEIEELREMMRVMTKDVLFCFGAILADDICC